MPRKPSPTLTEAEWDVMQVLWDRGPATVHEVVAALPAARKRAYNTVLTLLRILEQKGYVRHEKRGRAHRYIPVLDRATARRRALRYVLNQFFEGSPNLLLLNMIEDEQLDPDTLRRLRDLIEQLEREE